MKLYEISSNVNIKDLITVALALGETTSNDWNTSSGRKAFQELEAFISNPTMARFLYTGIMFRKFIQEGDVTPLTPKQILSHESSRRLFSFSKKRVGIENWEEQLGDIEDPETHTLIQQNGTGFDIQKIYRYVNMFSEDDIKAAVGSSSSKNAILYSLKRAGGNSKSGPHGPVFEVVAPLEPTLKVIDVDVVGVEHDEW